jgi:hypothetical protein
VIARTTAAGPITEVALALAVERGFEPREVLTYLRTSRMAGRWGGMAVGEEKGREALTLAEGTVQARIEFPGGQYSSGALTLRGTYPESLAMGALGRRIAAYVDHPALRASASSSTGSGKANAPWSCALGPAAHRRGCHAHRQDAVSAESWEEAARVSDALGLTPIPPFALATRSPRPARSVR